MNIADIEKVANRKRISAEAEKLRENVTRETANIIKLKVAQDTAYWDLKEKLHQLESNHERLQQNMVEVQMQHEALSGRYQEELRLRPETLNKLSSTREICDVLEEYSSRLKATVSRCQTDQATLAAAYNQSGQLVRDIKEQQLKQEEKSRQLIEDLQDKVKLVTEHKDQMTQLYSSSKQRLEADLNDARTKLSTALGQKDELFVALNDFSRKLDYNKRELEKKDENIANLQSDLNKLINELNNQGTELKSLEAKHEKELKEISETNETLQKALNNQEHFTRSVCDQNNQLQEKISAMEEEQISTLGNVKELEGKLEEAKAQCDQLIKEKTALNEKKGELEKDIEDKITLLNQAEMEKKAFTTQISALEAQISQGALELEAALEQSNLRSNKNDELTSVVQGLEAKIAEIESAMETLKLENTAKITDLNTTLESKDKIIEVKDKELDCKASTINQLMSDLKNVTDAKTKMENNFEKMKKNLETEKESSKEKERAWGKKVEQLETSCRDKENELTKQMTIILDMRNEKDRLQGRLKGMQSTIDNIEKEVTGRSAMTSLPPRQAAELDDNAVMMTPAPLQKKVGIHTSKASKPPVIAPREEQNKQDSLLYNLFSDSSMENELTVDPDEINRRFDALARGEQLSPLTFKRRKGPSSLLGGLKPISVDKPVSLSQVRENAVKSKRTFFKSSRPDNKAKKFKPDA